MTNNNKTKNNKTQEIRMNNNNDTEINKLKETKMKINDEYWKVNVIMTFDVPVSEEGTQLWYDVYVPEKVMTDRDSFIHYLCDVMIDNKSDFQYLWKISCCTNISHEGGIIESNLELGRHFEDWYTSTNGKFVRDFGDFDSLSFNQTNNILEVK